MQQLVATITAGHNPSRILQTMQEKLGTTTGPLGECNQWLQQAARNGLQHWQPELQDLAENIAELHQALKSSEQKPKRKAWHNFLEEAGSGGASWAHRWTKPLEELSIHTVKTIVGNTSTLQAKIQAQEQT